MTARQKKKAEVDATRAAAQANRFVTSAHNLLLDFPQVIRNCPAGSGLVCSTVDRYTTIQALTGLYAHQYSSARRFTARGSFNGTGKTNRQNPLAVQARSLRQQANANLASLPRFATSCN